MKLWEIGLVQDLYYITQSGTDACAARYCLFHFSFHFIFFLEEPETKNFRTSNYMQSTTLINLSVVVLFFIFANLAWMDNFLKKKELGACCMGFGKCQWLASCCVSTWRNPRVSWMTRQFEIKMFTNMRCAALLLSWLRLVQ